MEREQDNKDKFALGDLILCPKCKNRLIINQRNIDVRFCGECGNRLTHNDIQIQPIPFTSAEGQIDSGSGDYIAVVVVLILGGIIGAFIGWWIGVLTGDPFTFAIIGAFVGGLIAFILVASKGRCCYGCCGCDGGCGGGGCGGGGCCDGCDCGDCSGCDCDCGC